MTLEELAERADWPESIPCSCGNAMPWDYLESLYLCDACSATQLQPSPRVKRWAICPCCGQNQGNFHARDCTTNELNPQNLNDS